MTELPPDWRAQVVRALVQGETPSPTLLDPHACLPPARQLQIYRGQIRARFLGSLRRQLPGLAALEGEAFAPLCEAFLHDHPPRHASLYHLHDALPDWLAARGATRDTLEVVALDRAVGKASRAATPGPLPPLRPDSTLALAPSVTLLHLHRPWHDWRRQVLQSASPPTPPLNEVWIAVYQRGEGPKDQALDPREAALLQTFARPTVLAEALATVPPQVEAAEITTWFERFAARGWLAYRGG
ncbi:MAG: DUF2063 domain-containing protein [Deltaproteobacteria bacterium]|nr:MAG: DUF2063 domain-containing protein [Deltaproteobacteria bacterium]